MHVCIADLHTTARHARTRMLSACVAVSTGIICRHLLPWRFWLQRKELLLCISSTF